MRLKELREERKLTQQEVALAVGGTQSNLAKWEKEKVQPTSEFIVKLSDYFEVSADYLLGRSDDFGNVTVAPNTSALSSEEKAMLELFRSLGSEYRALAIETLKTWTGTSKKDASKRA